MAESMVAYYPGTTPLYEDGISLSEVLDDGLPTGITRVSVHDDRRLDFDILSHTESPRRVHTAYFTKLGGCPIRVCNVDLELESQPSMETVARTILGTEKSIA